MFIARLAEDVFLMPAHSWKR